MKEKKNAVEIRVETISTYIIVLLVGVIVGSSITFFMTPNKKLNTKVSKITNKKEFKPLNETYTAIKQNYYKDIDDEKLLNGAIDGMMKALDDDHSNFFDKESKKEFEGELSGTYYGIGAEIKQINDDEVMIQRVFDDSPAEKAGLKSGDIFVSIDGESTKGKTATELAKTLRSEKKEKATIVIRRDGEEKTFEIQKDNVNLLSVSSEMLDNNIGYITVSVFGEKTYNDFKNALEDLEGKGLQSLIIDLRGNSGGYLSTVTYMISEFVPSNKCIYQMKTREGTKKYNSINDTSRNYKIIVLVDEESASASEIMASAMQEQYKATLVGVTTYGKGTVQETLDLSNGTMIKYTIQEWLTSEGKSINGKGVKPDVEIELSDEYKNSPTRDNDNQLQKAIELAK